MIVVFIVHRSILMPVVLEKQAIATTFCQKTKNTILRFKSYYMWSSVMLVIISLNYVIIIMFILQGIIIIITDYNEHAIAPSPAERTN